MKRIVILNGIADERFAEFETGLNEAISARAGEAELNAQYEDLKKYDAFREALSALKNH